MKYTDADLERAREWLANVPMGEVPECLAQLLANERERCAQKCEAWAVGGSRALLATAREMAAFIRKGEP
jgi:hypothetical protein